MFRRQALSSPANESSELGLQLRVTTLESMWPLILTIPFAMLLPNEFLASNKLFKSYVLILQTIVPNIEAIARLSQFPDLTRVMLSMAFSIALVQGVLFWHRVHIDVRLLRAKAGECGVILIIFLGMLAVMIGIVDLMPHNLGGSARTDIFIRQVSESRLWLGIVAGLIGPVVAAMAVVSIALLLHSREILLNRGGHS